MKKDLTILYPVGQNLYVNVTNRCPFNCTFCLRQTMDTVSKEDPRSLWLIREPSVQEIIDEFQKFDVSQYKEIVFCGFGEPSIRLYDIFEVCDFLKRNYQNPIRINTNGMANLIWNKDTTKDFENRIDIVSISLNHPDAKQYQNLVRSKFGIKSHQAMLDFARDVQSYVKQVILTTVDTTISKEEEAKCQKICDNLGVTYRIRPFEE
ncbi:MAG: TatD family nuclease-associated radical SAM protein [Floccifex sp.]